MGRLVRAVRRAWSSAGRLHRAIEFSLPPRSLWGKGRGWGAAAGLQELTPTR